MLLYMFMFLIFSYSFSFSKTFSTNVLNFFCFCFVWFVVLFVVVCGFVVILMFGWYRFVSRIVCDVVGLLCSCE